MTPKRCECPRGLAPTCSLPLGARRRASPRVCQARVGSIRAATVATACASILFLPGTCCALPSSAPTRSTSARNKRGPIATDILWSDAPFAQASRRNEHGEIKTARARPAFARRLLLWIRHCHCFRCLCAWCVPSPLEATRPLHRPFCGCRVDEAWHGLRRDPFQDCQEPRRRCHRLC